MTNDPDSAADESEPQSQPFSVTDRESAEWVMEKIADAESALDAIERRRAQMHANYDAQARGPQSDLDNLLRLYGMQLEVWAKANLKGKRRSVTLDNGTISFREVKGTSKIVDMEKAVEWVKNHGGEHWLTVKESLAIENLEKAFDAYDKYVADNFGDAGSSLCPRHLIESTGPDENVAIGAGILKPVTRRVMPSGPVAISGDVDAVHASISQGTRASTPDDDFDF